MNLFWQMDLENVHIQLNHNTNSHLEFKGTICKIFLKLSFSTITSHLVSFVCIFFFLPCFAVFRMFLSVDLWVTSVCRLRFSSIHSDPSHMEVHVCFGL